MCQVLQRTWGISGKHATHPPLLSVQDFQFKRCPHEAGNIVSDPSHPLHRLFDPLPSGRRCRRIRARTMRMLNSFLPQPITLLNNNSIILIICPNNRPKVRPFLTPATYSHITLLSYSALFVRLCRWWGWTLLNDMGENEKSVINVSSYLVLRWCDSNIIQIFEPLHMQKLLRVTYTITVLAPVWMQ